MTIRSRMRKLEARAATPSPGDGECRCPVTAYDVRWPNEGDPEPEPTICPKCGGLVRPIVLHWPDEGDSHETD